MSAAAPVPPPSGRIVDGRHVLALRVYYEDTDAQGIVYYANWLRFLERGRTELLRLLGQEHSALREQRGINWVVRRCAIDYLKPARLDETIEVVTGCGELRGASVDMLQEARRGTETLVRAELIACMSGDGRPVRLPPQVRTALADVATSGDSPHLTPYSDIRLKRRRIQWKRLRRSPVPLLAAMPPRLTCRSMACSCRPTGWSRR